MLFRAAVTSRLRRGRRASGGCCDGEWRRTVDPKRPRVRETSLLGASLINESTWTVRSICDDTNDTFASNNLSRTIPPITHNAKVVIQNRLLSFSMRGSGCHGHVVITTCAR